MPTPNFTQDYFEGDEAATLPLNPKRKAYVHLIKGELKVNGQHLSGGDALFLAQETQIQLSIGKKAEVLSLIHI